MASRMPRFGTRKPRFLKYRYNADLELDFVSLKFVKDKNRSLDAEEPSVIPADRVEVVPRARFA